MASSERSKVEVSGWEAKYYDQLMWAITLGGYQRLIRKSVRDTGARPGDHIVEFGCGTGIAAKEFVKLIGPTGRYVGIDISPIMLEKACKKLKDAPNVSFISLRAEEDLPFGEKFNTAYTSFVFHGFEQPDRMALLKNAFDVLKPGGKMCILDYASFDIEKSNPIVKYFITKVECPLAAEFVRSDLGRMFEETGFVDYSEKLYALGYIRLACGRKSEQLPAQGKAGAVRNISAKIPIDCHFA